MNVGWIWVGFVLLWGSLVEHITSTENCICDISLGRMIQGGQMMKYKSAKMNWIPCDGPITGEDVDGCRMGLDDIDWKQTYEWWKC